MVQYDFKVKIVQNKYIQYSNFYLQNDQRKWGTNRRLS